MVEQQVVLPPDLLEPDIYGSDSIGGDSDTLAAISGAIAEAFYGVPTACYATVLSKLTPDLRKILRSLDEIDWPIGGEKA